MIRVFIRSHGTGILIGESAFGAISAVNGDGRAPTLAGVYRLMTGFHQSLNRLFQPIVLHEYIVGIKGRNREDRNRTIGKRLHERR
jgi:hypothetical protein